jgi:hypothetical protein
MRRMKNNFMDYTVIKETGEYVDVRVSFDDINRGPRTVRFFIDEDSGETWNVVATEHGRTFSLQDYFSDEEINELWTFKV